MSFRKSGCRRRDRRDISDGEVCSRGLSLHFKTNVKVMIILWKIGGKDDDLGVGESRTK